MEIATITPAEVAALCDSGAELIDVRTPSEFREVHAVPARNVPLDRLDPAAVMKARNGSAEQPLYLICRSGSRGRQACEKFVKAGYANVVNVDGGTQGWRQCGLPIVQGKKTMSLERQVRIAAGLLVCLGAVLGWLVHPGCVVLAFFVGAGLICAGVTDTCGMGMLLARMPWNRGCDPAACCGEKR